jgi:hypothetical protein
MLALQYKSHLQEHHIHLKKSNGTHLKENTCITTDPYHLRHILDNLMLNMMAFSENSNIWMNIALEDNQYLVIKFSNDDVELPETYSRNIKKHIATVHMPPLRDFHEVASLSWRFAGLQVIERPLRLCKDDQGRRLAEQAHFRHI